VPFLVARVRVPGRAGMMRTDVVPDENTDEVSVLKRELARLLPDLRAFARFLARDPVAADDLVQDTVVRALGALGQFRPGTNFKAWLFTIERNAFYEQGRRRRREDRVLREQAGRATAEAPAAFARGDVGDLQRLLFTLSPLLREALVLVGVQELSHEAAAAICGVPIGTMKARVSRARSALSRLAAE
jgi:RNA polymerase sigma factor (sigma-70 family)